MFNFYKCLQYVELPTAWIFIILELLVYMMHATSDGANYFPGTTQARLFAGHANLVKKCVCVCGCVEGGGVTFAAQDRVD